MFLLGIIMTMLDRAKEALKVQSDKDLAAALGMATTTIAGYKTRGGALPLEQCVKVSDLSGVDLNWLITGKGIATNGQSTISQDDFVKIPCFDIEASAGNGSTFDLENIIDEVMFSRVWMHAQGLFQKDLVCIQVKGDSMSGLLEDGDTVLVNTARKHGDGVFVIRIGEHVRIKRLQWLSDGHVKLISENPAYENELIDPKQLGDAFQVLGAAHTKIGRLS